MYSRHQQPIVAPTSQPLEPLKLPQSKQYFQHLPKKFGPTFIEQSTLGTVLPSAPGVFQNQKDKEGTCRILEATISCIGEMHDWYWVIMSYIQCLSSGLLSRTGHIVCDVTCAKRLHVVWVRSVNIIDLPRIEYIHNPLGTLLDMRFEIQAKGYQETCWLGLA